MAKTIFKLKQIEDIPLSKLTQSGASTGYIPQWDGTAWTAVSPFYNNVTANRLLGRVGTNGIAQEITLGTGLSFSGTTLNATTGSGTVTSIGLTMPSIFTVSTPNPITTNGTFGVTFNSQTAKTFFAAPNGAAGVPVFRAILPSDLGSGTPTASTLLLGSGVWTTIGTIMGNYELTSNKVQVMTSPNATTYPSTAAIATLYSNSGSLTNKAIFTASNIGGQIDMSPHNNRTTYHDWAAFGNATGAGTLVYETSSDNTTFVTGITPMDLFAQKTAITAVTMGPTLQAIRLTWANTNVSFNGIQWIQLVNIRSGTVRNIDILLEYSSDGVSWTTNHQSTNNILPIYNSYFRCNNPSVSANQIRLTISSTVTGSTDLLQLAAIRLLTIRQGSQGLGIETELPYNWNNQKHIIPVAPTYVGSPTTPLPSNYRIALFDTAGQVSGSGLLTMASLADVIGAGTIGNYVLKAGDSMSGVLNMSMNQPSPLIIERTVATSGNLSVNFKQTFNSSAVSRFLGLGGSDLKFGPTNNLLLDGWLVYHSNNHWSDAQVQAWVTSQGYITTDTNFATSNLTATGPRSHNFNSNDLSIINVGVFDLVAQELTLETYSSNGLAIFATPTGSSVAYLKTNLLTTSRTFQFPNASGVFGLAGDDINTVAFSGTTTKTLTLTKTNGVTLTSNFSTSMNQISDVIFTSLTTDQLLRYNGTNWVNYTAPWTTNTGTVTSVAAGNGMNFTTFSTTGTITMGTPSSITLVSTNSVGVGTHSHAFTPGGTNLQYIAGDGTLITFPSVGGSQNLQSVATLGNTYTGDLILGPSGSQVYVGAATGVENTRLGKDTLISISGTAQWNVAIGSGALNALTVGNNNTAVGEGAMLNYVTDSSSVFQNNTSVGNSSMLGATGGVANTMIGAGAGVTNGLRSRGNFNTFIGVNSGRYAPAGTLGDYNIFIGTYAGSEGILTSYQLRIGSRTNTGLTGAHIIEGYMEPTAPTLLFNAVVSIRDLNLSSDPINAQYVVRDPSTKELKYAPLSAINTNIYNSDGTLTGNRTVLGGNNVLSFANLNTFVLDNVSIFEAALNSYMSIEATSSISLSSQDIFFTSFGNKITLIGNSSWSSILNLSALTASRTHILPNANGTFALYEKQVISANFTGTTTKTLTLGLGDGTSLTASFTDGGFTVPSLQQVATIGNTYTGQIISNDFNATGAIYQLRTDNTGNVNNRNWAIQTNVNGVGSFDITRSLANNNSPLGATIALSIDINSSIRLPGLSGTGVRVVTADNLGNLSTATLTNGTVTSVTGTTNRISISGTAAAPIVDIASSYVGQTSITTLGTITTGTWNGTTIAIARGGTGLTTAGTNGQILLSNGTSWVLTTPTWTSNTGTVTSVVAGAGMNFTTFSTTGSIIMGTPSSITLSSTNSASGTTHSHAFAPGGSTSQYIRGDGSLATFPTATIPTWQQTLAAGFIASTAPIISVGTNTTSADYLSFYPTDFGTNKPAMTIGKSVTSGKWNISTYDGTNFIGNINFQTASLTWNDEILATRNWVTGLGYTTNTGTVTSWGITNNASALLTHSVSNATTTPVLTLGLTNAAAWTIFGRNAGTTGTPAFFTAGALSKTDDTNVTLSLTGNPTVALVQSTSIAVGWTGTLAVSRGGLGVGTITGVMIGNGTSAVTAITGTAGQLLRRNGANTAYEFFTPDYISGNQTITLTGPITGSGTTSIATTVGAGVITYANVQNVTANKLLGRVSSAGSMQEITLGSNLSFSGTTLNVTGLTTPSWNDTLLVSRNAFLSGATWNNPHFTLSEPDGNFSYSRFWVDDSGLNIQSSNVTQHHNIILLPIGTTGKVGIGIDPAAIADKLTVSGSIFASTGDGVAIRFEGGSTINRLNGTELNILTNTLYWNTDIVATRTWSNNNFIQNQFSSNQIANFKLAGEGHAARFAALGTNRVVQTYMSSATPVDELVAGHEYTWYSEAARVGIIRGGSTDIVSYAIHFNGVRKFNVDIYGNTTTWYSFTAYNTPEYVSGAKFSCIWNGTSGRFEFVQDINANFTLRAANGEANSVGYKDTRNNNFAPNGRYGGTWWDFKDSSVMGLGTAYSYAGVLTLHPFADDSGTPTGSNIAQIATYGYSLFYRPAGSLTTWGQWKTFAFVEDNNFIKNQLSSAQTGNGWISGLFKATDFQLAGNSTLNDAGGYLGLYTDGSHSVAQYMKVGRLVISDAYLDNAPSNGLFIKGSMVIGNGQNISWGGSYNPNIPTLAATSGTGLLFYAGDSSASEHMRLTNQGRLGIGITSPAQTLDVSGAIKQTNVVNAMVKAVGGVFTTAVAGTDYVIPSYLSHGVYTPTFVLGTSNNLSVTQVTDFTYVKVGNICIVSGCVDVTTSTTGTGNFHMTLPIPSNFTSDAQITGHGQTHGPGGNVVITVNTSTDRAIVNYSVPATAQRLQFTIQYEIV